MSTGKLYSQCDSVRIKNTMDISGLGDTSYYQEVIHFTATGNILDRTLKFQETNGALWETYIIEQFQYDGNDSILSYTNHSFYGVSVVDSRSEYTYDASGNRLTGISYYNSNITSSDTNSYDASNHLLESTKNNYLNRNRIIHSYNVAGEEISNLSVRWYGTTWIDSVRMNFYYDGNGKKLTEYTFENVAGVWDSTFIGYYHYNASNLVDTFFTMKDTLASWVNDDMYIYEYGVFNKQIHRYTLEWNVTEWNYVWDEVTEFNANGDPTLTERLWAFSTTIPISWLQDGARYTWYYDIDGKITSYTQSDSPYYFHESYQYSNGVMVSSIGENSSNMWSADHYSQFYYAELYGDTMICQNGNAMLQVDSCSGDSFLWSSGETTSSITVVADGDYQVTITRANGWVVQTPPVHVTMALTMTLPDVIEGSDSTVSLCTGNIVALSTPLETSVSYQWIGNNSASGNSNILNLNPAIFPSGDYFLIATNGCGSDTSSITHLYASRMNVSSNALGTSCIGCDNGKIHLNIYVSLPPYSVAITPNLGVISGDSVLSLPVGVYQICISDSLGCIKCVSDTIFEDPTGTDQLQSQILNVYPNPVSDQLTISYNVDLIGENYFIKDLTGKIIMNGKLSGNMTKIDLESLSSGIYFLSVNSKGISTLKFVKN